MRSGMWSCRGEQHLVSPVPLLRTAKIGEDCSARTIMWTSRESVHQPHTPSSLHLSPACLQPLTKSSARVFVDCPCFQAGLYKISHHRSLSLLYAVSPSRGGYWLSLSWLNKPLTPPSPPLLSLRFKPTVRFSQKEHRCSRARWKLYP